MLLCWIIQIFPLRNIFNENPTKKKNKKRKIYSIKCKNKTIGIDSKMRLETSLNSADVAFILASKAFSKQPFRTFQ